MPWDTSELIGRFGRTGNEDVLRFLQTEHPSAHDDVATCLTDCAKGLPGNGWFCPNPPAYAYVLVHTSGGMIYGLATGMSQIAFRLPPSLHAAAKEGGAQNVPEIGGEWLAFRPFDPPKPTGIPLRRWCELAFTYASGGIAPPSS